MDGIHSPSISPQDEEAVKQHQRRYQIDHQLHHRENGSERDRHQPPNMMETSTTMDVESANLNKLEETIYMHQPLHSDSKSKDCTGSSRQDALAPDHRSSTEQLTLISLTSDYCRVNLHHIGKEMIAVRSRRVKPPHLHHLTDTAEYIQAGIGGWIWDGGSGGAETHLGHHRRSHNPIA